MNTSNNSKMIRSNTCPSYYAKNYANRWCF